MLKIVGCPFILCVEKSRHNAALHPLLFRWSREAEDGDSENVDATARNSKVLKSWTAMAASTIIAQKGTCEPAIRGPLLIEWSAAQPMLKARTLSDSQQFL